MEIYKLPAGEHEEGRQVNIIMIKKPAKHHAHTACMREAIELDVACECAERLSRICHQEVEYNDGVPGIHRVDVVCRDCDKEECQRNVIHRAGNLEVRDEFVSSSDARFVVCLAGPPGQQRFVVHVKVRQDELRAMFATRMRRGKSTSQWPVVCLLLS